MIGQSVATIGPVVMDQHAGQLMIVESSPAQVAVVEEKAKRPHQVQPRPGVGAQTDDVAGILRNLRLDQNQVDHGQG